MELKDVAQDSTRSGSEEHKREVKKRIEKLEKEIAVQIQGKQC